MTARMVFACVTRIGPDSLGVKFHMPFINKDQPHYNR